jgi:phosphoglycolate phosphatase
MQFGGLGPGKIPRMSFLVVFDLDGTLVDSREDLAASVNDVLAAIGSAPLAMADVIQMVGDGARTLVERALARAGASADAVDIDDALARFHRCYADRLLNTTRPYPGIDEVLAHLRPRCSLAVLTNKPIAPTRRILGAWQWSEVFGRVIGGDEVWGRKPDPAGLRDLMDWAGTPPGETMLVGDSMVDIETARAVGATACVARWGFGHARGDLVLRGDELLAESPADVIRLLASRT